MTISILVNRQTTWVSALYPSRVKTPLWKSAIYAFAALGTKGRATLEEAQYE